MEPITCFRGKNEFLSDGYGCFVVYEGTEYPSLQHAFQAAKTLDEAERFLFRICPSAKDARQLGRTVKLRADWEDVKEDIMYSLLCNKFSDPTLQEKLIGTRDPPLIYVNTWHDTFWGIYKGIGSNRYGMLLMKVRDELRQELDRR